MSWTEKEATFTLALNNVLSIEPFFTLCKRVSLSICLYINKGISIYFIFSSLNFLIENC